MRVCVCICLHSSHHPFIVGEAGQVLSLFNLTNSSLSDWLVGWLALRIPNTLSAKYKSLGVLRWLLGSGSIRGLTVGVDTKTHC